MVTVTGKGDNPSYTFFLLLGYPFNLPGKSTLQLLSARGTRWSESGGGGGGSGGGGVTGGW